MSWNRGVKLVVLSIASARLGTRLLSSNHYHVDAAAPRKTTYLVKLGPAGDPNLRSHTQIILQENNVFHRHDRPSLDPRLHTQ